MRRKKGFTLIEILFVVAVLAALAGLAIPRITGTILQSKRDTDKANISIINSQLELYRLNTGAYPTDNSDFQNFLNNTTYFPEIPYCPWGDPYIFDNAGGNNRVITTGHGDDHT